MKKLKLVGAILLGIIVIVFLGLYITDFINDEEGQMADIIMWVLIVLVFFQFATWGSDRQTEKDEMGKQIKDKSGRISYYILTVLLLAFWFIENIVNGSLSSLGNVLILTALCLAVIIYPIVQYIFARKIFK
ncbi:hypothetical protein [Piscibacillus salipiscarius]|uniref:Permease n=1 Tax=Piscibacillus salipiscarius TaxID=299480 RepID=A0ABW5QCP8_9BACI